MVVPTCDKTQIYRYKFSLQMWPVGNTVLLHQRISKKYAFTNNAYKTATAGFLHNMLVAVLLSGYLLVLCKELIIVLQLNRNQCSSLHAQNLLW